MNTIPFTSDRWNIQAEESRTETYLDQPSLFLKSGVATLDDVVFTDGVIEYDVAFGPGRGFAGVTWRIQDAQNYETFFMRSHQSGNPDATQYTPIFNGVSGWQLYADEGFNAQVKFSFNQWMHVKLIVAGTQAEVYIDDMEQPALFMPHLKREGAAGGVGISAGVPFTSAHFANVSVAPTASPPSLKSAAEAPEETPDGTVPAWLVSESFSEAALTGKISLTGADKQNLTWTNLAVESSGLANLARVQGLSKEKNTAFARFTVVSDAEQMKPLQFGFSDKVKVYLNDQLLYAGNDVAYSRDYRFLGTIGFYDELYLPLEAGPNELWFAVSEGFISGGWGVQARFVDLEGLSFE